MSIDWQTMETAPRDGTVVEIKNSYGLLPTFGLFRWERDSWRSATNPRGGLMEGVEHKFSWRPHNGDLSTYRDYNPSIEDWRRAARR